MDGVIAGFSWWPRQRRLDDSLLLCLDLLCLAKLRLPMAQSCDKEMWVSQPSLLPMFKGSAKMQLPMPSGGRQSRSAVSTTYPYFVQ
jgi:hypothetical protein